jgi:hypothetical protein
LSKRIRMIAKAVSDRRGSGTPPIAMLSPEQEGPPVQGTIGAGMTPA